MTYCLQAVREHAEEHAATLAALSLCAQHLQEILLDRKVLPFGSFRQLPGCQKIGDRDIRAEMPLYLSLDGSAFDNLEVSHSAEHAAQALSADCYPGQLTAITATLDNEARHLCGGRMVPISACLCSQSCKLEYEMGGVQVLENADGGTEGSLISALDHCATVMGKRRLRAWLCRPMARIAGIVARQDAVADFMDWPASEAAQTARCTLSGETEGSAAQPVL